MKPIRVGIIADYNPKSKYHIATDAALQHAAAASGNPVESIWLDTDRLDDQQLKSCDALVGGPGSPYRSMEGALHAIRFAREQGYPFIGT